MPRFSRYYLIRVEEEEERQRYAMEREYHLGLRPFHRMATRCTGHCRSTTRNLPLSPSQDRSFGSVADALDAQHLSFAEGLTCATFFAEETLVRGDIIVEAMQHMVHFCVEALDSLETAHRAALVMHEEEAYCATINELAHVKEARAMRAMLRKGIICWETTNRDRIAWEASILASFYGLFLQEGTARIRLLDAFASDVMKLQDWHLTGSTLALLLDGTRPLCTVCESQHPLDLPHHSALRLAASSAYEAPSPHWREAPPRSPPFFISSGVSDDVPTPPSSPSLPSTAPDPQLGVTPAPSRPCEEPVSHHVGYAPARILASRQSLAADDECLCACSCCIALSPPYRVREAYCWRPPRCGHRPLITPHSVPFHASTYAILREEHASWRILLDAFHTEVVFHVAALVGTLVARESTERAAIVSEWAIGVAVAASTIERYNLQCKKAVFPSVEQTRRAQICATEVHEWQQLPQRVRSAVAITFFVRESNSRDVLLRSEETSRCALMRHFSAVLMPQLEAVMRDRIARAAADTTAKLHVRHAQATASAVEARSTAVAAKMEAVSSKMVAQAAPFMCGDCENHEDTRGATALLRAPLPPPPPPIRSRSQLLGQSRGVRGRGNTSRPVKNLFGFAGTGPRRRPIAPPSVVHLF